MNNKIQITKESFDNEVLMSGIPVLLEFGAPWCSSCRVLEDVLASLAEQYEGKVKFAHVNVDEEDALRERHGIFSVPALFLYQNGEVARKKIGMTLRQEVIDFIGLG